MNENFNIGKQIDKEIKSFYSSTIKLAVPTTDQNANDIRYLVSRPAGYVFNQRNTITLIDLYYNSQFESGERDELGQKKIFMNIGRFRTEVAAKQVDIDSKDFRFVPDDFADPWVAVFLQKDFKEWSRKTEFPKLIEEVIDNLPKYGSAVLKKVGKELKFVPLQNLVVEQSAESLHTARYVIEDHPDMTMWELQEMPNWKTEGLKLKYDEKVTVHERYGYVPLAWVNKYNGRPYTDDQWNTYVDALTITCKHPSSKTENNQHIFFCDVIKDRPYREVHWSRQHGRWLGIGVMESLLQNQEAQNIIMNLYRRSLQWSSKRVMQTATNDMMQKNLVRDVKDGDVLEVGPAGEMKPVDLGNKNIAEFQTVLQNWEKNADQKAFTYDIVTGALAARTPYRLAIILANAVASYYAKKKKNIGLFFEEIVKDFLLPQFFKDMDNGDRTLSMFSGEAGFEVLKEAALDYVQVQAMHTAIQTGNPVDAGAIADVLGPFLEMKTFFFNMPKGMYKDKEFQFQFTVTEESFDIKDKVQNLTVFYQALSAQGDPRAQKVAERIAQLEGIDLAEFEESDSAATPTPAQMAMGRNPGLIGKQPNPNSPAIKRGGQIPQPNA